MRQVFIRHALKSRIWVVLPLAAALTSISCSSARRPHRRSTQQKYAPKSPSRGESLRLNRTDVALMY